MRVVVSLDTLRGALSRANRLVSRLRKAYGLQEGVLLEIHEGKLKVISTDTENWLIQNVPTYEAEKGRVFVPLKEVLQIIKSAKGAEVLLEYSGDSLVMQVGAGRYSIKTFDDGEFPPVPDIGVHEGYTVDLEGVIHGLSMVEWCVSGDGPNPVLNCIYLHSSGGKLKLAATDSTVLGLWQGMDFSGEVDLLVYPVISSVLKTLDKGPAILSRVGDYLVITGETEGVGVLVMVKALDEDFFDYESVLPSEFVAWAVVDTRDLLASVSRILILSPENTKDVELSIGPNVLSLRTLSFKGEAEENLDAETYGNSSVKLMGNYLVNALKRLGKGKVGIYVSGEDVPVKIKPADSDEVYYLLMPLQ